MKNKAIKITLCLLLVLAMFGASLAFVACGEDGEPGEGTPPAGTAVNVVIDGGTGSGTYKEGDKCTATATVPEGYKFVEWTVYGVSVSTANPYTFDVDFDIEVKAVFEKLPVAQYTVTVSGGTIGDTGLSTAKLDEGTAVEIHASESQARDFKYWQIGEEQSTENPYRLTVEGDVTMTAVFDEYCMISVSGGTVENERSKIYLMGSEVTVVANESGDDRVFEYWYTLDEAFNEVPVSEDTTYTFTLLDSMKIYAKFSQLFTVSVVNGTVGDTGETSSKVPDSDIVMVKADAAPSADKAFIGWYHNGTKISIDKEYSFEVINNITLEAKYGELRVQPAFEKPDSSGNPDHLTDGIIYMEGGGAIAFDRLSNDKSKSMYNENVAYVRYDVYTSADADPEEPVGSFRIRVDYGKDAGGGTVMTGWVETVDGTVSENIVRGDEGNYFVERAETDEFFSVLRAALGYEYCSGQQYYFAATVVAPEDPVITMEDDFAFKYVDSERSAITTSSIRENANAPVAYYDIKVENGTIDEDLTEVTAGHGAYVTVSTTMPEDDTKDWVFLGWKEVTYDGEEATIGATVSRDLEYTFAANKDVILRAVFADRSEISQQQLTTPDNTDNKLIYCESGSIYAFDRGPSSMFGTDVDYVVFYIYDSSDAEKTDYLGRFKMYVDPTNDGNGGAAMVGYVSLMDGSQQKTIIRGNLNNYYTVDGGQLLEVMRAALGDNYTSGTSYYFAAQSIAHADSLEWIDSDISAIGTNGIRP